MSSTLSSLSKNRAILLILVFYLHHLDCKSHDIYSGERKITAPHRCLFSESVLKHACAASHGCHFVKIALGVFCIPKFVTVVCGVKIQEVREESSCSDFAGQFIEVIVRVFWKIADSSFFLPYLDWEYSGCPVAHAFISGVEQFPYHASSFGGCVGL